MKQRAEKLHTQLTRKGWTTSQSPAVPSTTSEKGSQGGMLMLHRPWLTTAIPTAATGESGQWFEAGDDINWKHFRIRGVHLIVIFAYFQCNIGLSGVNLTKLRKLLAITDQGRKSFVCMGDFNMPPAEWQKGSHLQSLNCVVRTAGDTHTHVTTATAPALSTMLSLVMP